ncbi:hypothetical protein F66182_15580, partial [Fusarium sp. NRRL 66182]
MGQTTSKIDEKEAVAGMARLSIDKNAYVFVENDTLPPPYEASDRINTISVDQTRQWEEKLLSSAR